MPPLLTRDFGLLVTGHFLQALGFASMPLLPLYLEHLGASRTEIGAVMATGNLGGLLLRPFVGWALDALGRKPTLVAGTLCVAAGMLLLGLVRSIGPVIYLDRLIFGIGAGTLFTGYFTFASDLIPARRRTEGIALFGVSGLVPLAVNPFTDRLGLAPADLRWFFPLLGLLVLASLLALRPLREPARPPSAEPLTAGAVARALLHRSAWPVWVATTVFAGLVGVFMAFATVTAEARGIAEARSIWLTYALGAVSVRVVGARLPDRLGPSNLVAPAVAAYVGAVLLVAGSESAGGMLAAGALAGLGHGYCFPILTGQVVDRMPERLRGSALAMFTALWELAALALTPAFGAVADVRGDAVMFSLCALFALVGLAIWAPLEHRLGPRSTPGDS